MLHVLQAELEGLPARSQPAECALSGLEGATSDPSQPQQLYPQNTLCALRGAPPRAAASG